MSQVFRKLFLDFIGLVIIDVNLAFELELTRFIFVPWRNKRKVSSIDIRSDRLRPFACSILLFLGFKKDFSLIQ